MSAVLENSVTEKKDKLKSLMGGSFVFHQAGARKIKRYFKPSSKDLIDFINEMFSQQLIDKGFFTLERLIDECDYSEVQIKRALAELKEKNYFLIVPSANNSFLIAINKPSNIDFVKNYSEDKLSKAELYFIKEFDLSKDKKHSPTKSSIFSFKSYLKTKTKKNENETKKNENHSHKNENQTKKFGSEWLDPQYFQYFQELENHSLDLYSLDLLFINHTSLEIDQSSIETLPINEIKNDVCISNEIKEEKEIIGSKEVPESLFYKSIIFGSKEHQEYLESDLHRKLFKEYVFSSVKNQDCLDYLDWVDKSLEISFDFKNKEVPAASAPVQEIKVLLSEKEIIEIALEWGYKTIKSELNTNTLELFSNGIAYVKSYSKTKDSGKLLRSFVKAEGFEIGISNSVTQINSKYYELLQYFGLENCKSFDEAKEIIGDKVYEVVQKIKSNPDQEIKKSLENFIYYASQITGFEVIRSQFKGESLQIIKNSM